MQPASALGKKEAGAVGEIADARRRPRRGSGSACLHAPAGRCAPTKVAGPRGVRKWVSVLARACRETRATKVAGHAGRGSGSVCLHAPAGRRASKVAGPSRGAGDARPRSLAHAGCGSGSACLHAPAGRHARPRSLAHAGCVDTVAACWQPGVCPRALRARQMVSAPGQTLPFRFREKSARRADKLFSAKRLRPGSLATPGPKSGVGARHALFPVRTALGASQVCGPCAPRRYSSRHAMLSVS